VPLPLILDIESKPVEPVSGYAPPHDDGFHLAVVRKRFGLSRSLRFQAFLDTRPAELFRGKGLPVVRRDRQALCPSTWVGNRFTIADDPRPAHGPNRLVLIGRKLDADDLESAVEGLPHTAIVDPRRPASISSFTTCRQHEQYQASVWGRGRFAYEAQS